MRRILLAAATVSTLLLASVAGSLPATASAPGAGYATPFREDGATFSANGQPGGAFSGGIYLGQATDGNGCVAKPVSTAPAGNPTAYNCLPAAASIVQLADGRLLYWDAVEGTETGTAFGGLNFAATDLGRITVNDESRLLTLNQSGGIATGGGTFVAPATVAGGAHSTSTAEDLPLPAPIAATHYAYNNGSLFCSDQVLLSDGSVLDVGGTDYYTEPTTPGTDKGLLELEGIKATRIFSMKVDNWVSARPMNHGRWYPSLVTLGNGHVFVASGVTKLIKPVYPTHPLDSGTNVKATETYDPTVDAWTDNGAGAQRTLPLFPRLHLLPDGHVYYDAGGQDFNPAGQSYDEALWNVAATYDPSTQTWHDLGIPGLVSAGVNPLFAGFRGSTFSAVLPLRPNANDTYTRASFLSAGGVLLPPPGSYVAVADGRINTVTTDSSGNDQLSTTPTGSLGRGRWFSTAVPLPDGSVYAVSGADVDEVIAPGLESPILQSELFTPTVDSGGNYTGGSWRPAGQQDRRRTYHNTAILLPDGSVLIGGNAPIPFLDAQVMDGVSLPGRPGTNNHHDPSFQLYRPPYFDKKRPVILSIASQPGALIIHTPQAATIASVVLMRNTALTHLVDGDARSVVLAIQSRDPTPSDPTVTVQLPPSSNVLPNGPYLLFANQNAANVNDLAPGHVVPSIGAQVFAEGTNPATTPTILVTAPAATYGATVKAATNASRPAAGAQAARAAAAVVAAPSRVPAVVRGAAGTQTAALGREAAAPIGAGRVNDRSGRAALPAVAAAAAVLLAASLVVIGGRRRRWRRVT